jgi:hypothetical protein
MDSTLGIVCKSLFGIKLRVSKMRKPKPQDVYLGIALFDNPNFRKVNDWTYKCIYHDLQNCAACSDLSVEQFLLTHESD